VKEQQQCSSPRTAVATSQPCHLKEASCQKTTVSAACSYTYWIIFPQNLQLRKLKLVFKKRRSLWVFFFLRNTTIFPSLQLQFVTADPSQKLRLKASVRSPGLVARSYPLPPRNTRFQTLLRYLNPLHGCLKPSHTTSMGQQRQPPDASNSFRPEGNISLDTGFQGYFVTANSVAFHTPCTVN